MEGDRMLPDIFKTTDLLQKGLSASQLRQDTIANNIANIDTPGFKASHVEFESYMKDALENDSNSFSARTTRDKHISFGSGDAEDVEPTVVTDTSTSMRMDGNNVDIDAESADQAKNTIYYYSLASKLNGEIERLKLAIDGR
jgi:flagellar basal-body rod protein FlgB